MNFLTHIDLNKNQLQNAVIHPLGTAPSGVEGQIYYNSTPGDRKLYYHDGTSWTPIGDITSIATSTSQLVVTNGASGNVSLSLEIATAVENGGTGLVTSGTVYSYIGGLSLVTSLIAGSGIDLSGSTGDITISHTDTSSAVSLTATPRTYVTGLTFDTFGHVTGYTTGTEVVVDTDNYVDSVTFNTATGDLTLGRTGILPDLTASLDGRYLQTSSWTITDGVNSQSIDNGETLTVSATDEIEATVSITNTLTIGHADVTRGDSSTSISPAHGATFNVIDSVTTNPRGHVTAVNLKSVTLPADNNTDTLQSIASDISNAERYITTVANDAGAQTGFSHPNLRYNPSTETLIVDNLIVSGTTTTINTETINLADNIITLNSNEAGAPTQNAGIEIERGTSANRTFRWNETFDIWEVEVADGVFNSIGTASATTVTGATTIPVVHNLNSLDVIVQLYYANGIYVGETLYAEVKRVDVNTVNVSFTTAPTDNIRVLVYRIK